MPCLPLDASYQAGVTWFTAFWESALQRMSSGGAACGVCGWSRPSHSSPTVLMRAPFRGTPQAYHLYLIGVVLFADKTSNQVQLLYLKLLDDPWERIAEYSWGSVAVGYLYRRLCGAAQKNVKEIAGPLSILQVTTITFNSNLYLVNYILITFAIVSCGCGSIF